MSLSLIAFIAANVLAAMSGAIFKPGEWFRSLNKPSWQPPDWAFPVVWTVLYLLNAIAGWLVFQQTGFSSQGVVILTVYGVSLLLNAAWSAIFFGAKRMDLATWEAAILWASIVVQMALFFSVDTTAALMLVPYLAWVSVAFFLSLKIWKLNPEAAGA